MGAKRLNLGLRLILSAALAMGALVPPAFRHSHAGGAKPHHHGRHVVSRCHDDDCHHHHGPVPSHGPELAAAADHWHLVLLGWTPSLPVSADSEQPARAGRNLFVPSVQATADQGDGPANPLATVGIFVTARAERSVVDAAAFRASTMGPRASLCDTARHERSGVQLA
ncbi:MAG: hypothetical protein HYX69_00845 [Planctomycetia bacterium]|nr:hypothetical protein [Planctomycetia bacterium]